MFAVVRGKVFLIVASFALAAASTVSARDIVVPPKVLANAPAPEFRDEDEVQARREAFRPPLLVRQTEAQDPYATLNIPIQFAPHFVQGPVQQIVPIGGTGDWPWPTILGGLTLSAGAALLAFWLARRWSAPTRRAVAASVALLAISAGLGAAFADIPPFGHGGPVPDPVEEVVKDAKGKTELKIVFVEEGEHVELILPKSVPVKAK